MSGHFTLSRALYTDNVLLNFNLNIIPISLFIIVTLISRYAKDKKSIFNKIVIIYYIIENIFSMKNLTNNFSAS